MTCFIPETAPFDETQRSWLNGFFAGLMGMEGEVEHAAARAGLAAAGTAMMPAIGEAGEQPDADADFPWHDSELSLEERMKLAEDRPLDRRLMAAMAQLDCGSCGYVCKTYAEAIASGSEKNLTLCSPGGRETKQMVKLLLKDGNEAGNAGASDRSPTKNGHVSGGSHANGHANATASVVTNGYSRNNPYPAKFVESRKLTKEESQKDVRHVVIDLEGSGLTYQVGDALGVWPVNCDRLASRIVARLGSDGSTRVSTPLGNEKRLIDALREDCCLREPGDELLELLAERIEDPGVRESLLRMLGEGPPPGFDVLDALETAERPQITATEFVETLAPLNPRLYSIAGSPRRAGSRVHLTVGKVSYEMSGRQRHGVASTMLSERLIPGERIRVFVQPNHGGFNVPLDDAAPMIMVGPGTGIAPFMAFLQERQARGASGDNWLFFGDRTRQHDFLYEDELNGFVGTGLLTRLDTAFSRDGDQKVYVQDRMREHGGELWRWLSRGGHFYVCGDASRMAVDVEKALTAIVAEHGGYDEAGAKAFLKRLAAEGRYVKDVY